MAAATARETPQDQTEDEESDAPDMYFSTASDAHWVKKGSKSTLGYKGFARADKEGYIDRVHTTPANKAESPQFDKIAEGAKSQCILADKTYERRANRQAVNRLLKNSGQRRFDAQVVIFLVLPSS